MTLTFADAAPGQASQLERRKSVLYRESDAPDLQHTNDTTTQGPRCAQMWRETICSLASRQSNISLPTLSTSPRSPHIPRVCRGAAAVCVVPRWWTPASGSMPSWRPATATTTASGKSPRRASRAIGALRVVSSRTALALSTVGCGEKLGWVAEIWGRTEPGEPGSSDVVSTRTRLASKEKGGELDWAAPRCNTGLPRRSSWLWSLLEGRTLSMQLRRYARACQRRGERHGGEMSRLGEDGSGWIRERREMCRGPG